MPRPRYDKLEPAKQRAILATAAEEFAEHGYEAASFNRIIERSGISKGAFYYYFDDKEDLYTTVLRDALQRLVFDVGEMGSARDAVGFWREFEAWYVRSLRLFQEEPNGVGLARSLVKALARGTATGVLAELRLLARAWLDDFIAQGQRLGAIRRDLPEDLLVSLLMAVEEGIDLWLGARIGDMTDAEIESTAAMLTRVYRRFAEPDAGADSKSTASDPKAGTSRKTKKKSRR